jgi:catechol 2,3-dioxygenase-like lactoylglutathione lyase family enzyme
MKSLFPVICTDDITGSTAFYRRLLGFTPVFEAHFYVQLRATNNPAAQIAFVQRGHPSVPEGYRNRPDGVIVTVELDDVVQLHARAIHLDVPIVLDLRDEPWGQRHFMARDPAGLLLDLVQLIPPTSDYAIPSAVG